MFGALPYLDWRIVVNQVRSIVRSRRIIPWILYLGYIGGMLYLRTHLHHDHTSSIPSREFATAIGGGALAYLGISIATATLKQIRPFRARADAAFLVRGGTSVPALVLWLQVRTIGGRSWYLIGTMVFYAVNIVPFGEGVSSIRALAILLILTPLAVSALQLPIFLLAIRGYRTLLLIFAGGLLLVGALLAIHDPIDAIARNAALPAGLHATALVYQAWIPLGIGDIVRAALAGSGLLPLALIVLMIGATLLAWALASDVYPELCEIALAQFDRTVRVRRGESGAIKAVTTRGWIPSGPAIMLWKSAVVFSRSQSQKVMLGVWAFVGIGIGGLLGIVLRDTDPESLIISAGVPLLLLAVIGFVSTFSLAADVVKPFWWLTSGSLFERLVYWTLGETHRNLLVFALAVCTESLVGGYGLLAIASTIAAATLWWSMYALGTLVFVLLPAAADRSGPGIILRFVTTWIPLVLLVGVFAATFALTHSLGMGFAMMTLVALIFGVVALAFAAERLAFGGGALLSRAAAESV